MNACACFRWIASGPANRASTSVAPHATAEVHLPDGTTAEVGAGTHAWVIAAPADAALPSRSLGSSFREIADDTEALETVLGVLRAHDTAYEELVRRRVDWNVTDPLPAGLFDMPPAGFGALAAALGVLSGRRA